jgi:ribosomal protein S5
MKIVTGGARFDLKFGVQIGAKQGVIGMGNAKSKEQ